MNCSFRKKNFSVSLKTCISDLKFICKKFTWTQYFLLLLEELKYFCLLKGEVMKDGDIDLFQHHELRNYIRISLKILES